MGFRAATQALIVFGRVLVTFLPRSLLFLLLYLIFGFSLACAGVLFFGSCIYHRIPSRSIRRRLIYARAYLHAILLGPQPRTRDISRSTLEISPFPGDKIVKQAFILVLCGCGCVLETFFLEFPGSTQFGSGACGEAFGRSPCSAESTYKEEQVRFSTRFNLANALLLLIFLRHWCQQLFRVFLLKNTHTFLSPPAFSQHAVPEPYFNIDTPFEPLLAENAVPTFSNPLDITYCDLGPEVWFAAEEFPTQAFTSNLAPEIYYGSSPFDFRSISQPPFLSPFGTRMHIAQPYSTNVSFPISTHASFEPPRQPVISPAPLPAEAPPVVFGSRMLFPASPRLSGASSPSSSTSTSLFVKCAQLL